MKIRVNWDALGVATAIACAIHCALLPLFLTSLPLFGINIVHNGYFESGMVLLAFCIGVYSLSHGLRRHHHNIFPLLIFVIGFIFLVLKLFFVQYENWLLIPAVSFIISAHILNYFYCRKANHCHASDCVH